LEEEGLEEGEVGGGGGWRRGRLEEGEVWRRGVMAERGDGGEGC
jgi:hypothetical protein